MYQTQRKGKVLPCHCCKCNGALVSESTFRRHAPSRISSSAHTVSASTPGLLSRRAHSQSDRDSGSGGSPSSSRPRKRIRPSHGSGDDSDEDNSDSEESHGEEDESESEHDQESIKEEHDDEYHIPGPEDSSPCHSHSRDLGNSDDDESLSESDDNLSSNDSRSSGEPFGDDQDVDEEFGEYGRPFIGAAQAFLNAHAQGEKEPEEEDLDQDRSDSDDEDGEDGGHIHPNAQSKIEHVKLTQDFIREISSATFNNGNLDDDVIEQLKNPESFLGDIDDPDTCLSIDLFMACGNASQATYRAAREAVTRRFPEADVLSYHLVKKLVARVTGVVSVRDDMCINSCHAFTGPFSNRENCAMCGEPRYEAHDPAQVGSTTKNKKIPRRQMCTIPLGPQIQALRRSEYGANAMKYRQEKTQKILEELEVPNLDASDIVYDDVFSGSDYLELAERLDLTADDTLVSFSIDGAQLYQQKESDTWIGIWVINDFDPTTRYKKKHVLPALIVPGPKKPKNLDSYLFRSFHHLSALQRNNNGAGLPCWNALHGGIIDSRIIFLLGNADAVGLPELDGRVGHHGACGCRISCDMKGRHKPGHGHYFAAHQKPLNYDIADCNHPDIDIRNLSKPSANIYSTNLQKVISSVDQNSFTKNRKDTGISKPSLLSGLVPNMMLPIPLCFSVDLMHLLFLNIPQLLLQLWRGTLKCENTDDKTTWDWAKLVGQVWETHGKLVADATQYFPSSFHRPPRNPAEKISSGFKATEYYLYIFGLGPGFFRPILPQKYWKNFCKLVHTARILIQHKITGAQVREAQYYAIQFVEEYELLYYQRRVDRLHFCRPALHTLLHGPGEITRVGPGAYNTQFTMERAIGDLGKDIRQHSNPFSNLCEIALRQSQINTLKTIYPQFDRDMPDNLPRYSRDLRNGYVLMRPRDGNPHRVQNIHQREVLQDELHTHAITRWGRVRLPNGQVARSVRSESGRKSSQKRNSRNVKIKLGNRIQYGEIQFYFLCKGNGSDSGSASESAESEADENLVARALISLYGPPDADLLEQSSQTLWACEYRPNHFRIIDVSAILSVISMQPLPKCHGEVHDLWFVVEKSGLDDNVLTGYVEQE